MGYADPKVMETKVMEKKGEKGEKGEKVAQNWRMSGWMKLEAALCGVVLVGTITYQLYVVKMYSDYFSQNGLFFGTLRGEKSLADGWLFKDRLVDLTDEGWRRPHHMNLAGLPIWFVAAALLKRVMRASFPKYEGKTLVLFYLTYACYHHRGAKIFLLLLFVIINYFLVKHTAGTKFGALCIWGYNMTWFFFGKQEWCVLWMIQHFQAPIWGMGNLPLKSPLWNMALKNISYGMDYHWAKSKKVEDFAVCVSTPEGAYKERVDKHLPLDYYNDIWTYLQFHFYPALYIEGPIITFNDFVSQYKGFSTRKMEYKQLLWQGFRLVVGFFVVETFLHFIYTDAIVKSGLFEHIMGTTSQWSNPLEVPVLGGLGLLSLFTSGFLSYYGKRFVKWRWGRFWSLVDGMDPPEDFPKCVACSRNMGEFWRNWHASINKWCTRYIYIPLGGSKGSTVNKCFSIFVVFMFTALWHTINLHFAIWGVLLIGFAVGEMLVRWMPAKLESLHSPTKVSNMGNSVATEGQSATWTQSLEDIGSTVPLLGFLFINMGAFLFGYGNIWFIMGLFARDIRLFAMLFSGAYANQRLVTLYHFRKQAQESCKIHVD